MNKQNNKVKFRYVLNKSLYNNDNNIMFDLYYYNHNKDEYIGVYTNIKHNKNDKLEYITELDNGIWLYSYYEYEINLNIFEKNFSQTYLLYILLTNKELIHDYTMNLNDILELNKEFLIFLNKCYDYIYNDIPIPNNSFIYDIIGTLKYCLINCVNIKEKTKDIFK